MLTLVAVDNFYQSNGACQDTCLSKYAFAILRGRNCWCSNYAPGFSVNTLRCNDPCPGFPNEWCGSSSSGLFAYFQLDLLPSGTSARSSAQSWRTPGSPVSGPLTTESPKMFSFPGSWRQPPVSSQVEFSPSVSPVLTLVTPQSTAPATSKQPTVTVTGQAPSPSPSSSV